MEILEDENLSLEKAKNSIREIGRENEILVLATVSESQELKDDKEGL